MKSVWYYIVEAILFFLILGLIYNILGRFNVIMDLKNPDKLVIIIAIVFLFFWTFAKMKINRKVEKSKEE